MSVGKWDAVRVAGQEARELCERLGDSRQWGDALSLLAEGAYLSSDIAEGLRIQNNLLEDARRRNSPLHIIWGLAGVATNLIRLGQNAQGVSMLKETLQILQDLPNRASSINAHAQLAFAYRRLGENEKAIAHAAETLKLAEGGSPTNYALIMGFAAIAEVYLSYWDALHASGSTDTASLKLSAEKALKLLHTYKNVFPIGQAYTLYYQGWYEALMHKPDAAVRSWANGLNAAQKYNLIFEEALLRMKLGVHEKDSTARAKHFKRAIEILEVMGATYELRVAKETAQRVR
jgi:tetratricopeptide (TPR) repeat protein